MARAWGDARLRLDGMDPWLRALSALACGVVLAVAGWWGWSAWEEARQGEAPAAPSSLEVVPEGLAAWQDECLAVVAAKDQDGEPPVAEASTPATAEQVARCRDIVTMRPREWPTN